MTLQNTASEAIRILAGILGVSAAVASGVQTSAKYAQRAERHRQASRQYGAVVREIAELRAVPPPEDQVQQHLDRLRKILDDTGAMAPNVIPRIWNEEPSALARIAATVKRRR